MARSPSRSAGARAGPAAIAAVGLIAAAALPPSATPGTSVAGVAGPTPGARTFGRVGMNSCAARGCHGAVGPVDPASGDAYIAGGAYTTWRAFDPHARAYSALLGPRSVAIAARLRGPLAHESGRCLSCHATPSSAVDAAPASRSVDCEGCHGPAGGWGEAHLALRWSGLGPDAKAASGLRDLSGPRARAESCADCHVGDRSRGMDVDHDLIAAGHPRLTFESATYLAALPRHWRAGGDHAETRARSWAVGQAVTARAALQLLADRAEAAAAGGTWPELAESECFACHHVPSDPGPRSTRDPAATGAGRAPWATWPSAMLPVLAADRPEVGEAWAKVRAEMTRPEPDAARAAALAREGLGAFDAWIKVLEASRLDPGRLAEIASRLETPGRAETWDELAQRYLAIEALRRAPGRPAAEPPARLDFEPGYDSPREGRPGQKP